MSVYEKFRERFAEYEQQPGDFFIPVGKKLIQQALELLDELCPDFQYTLPSADGAYRTKHFVWFPPNAAHPDCVRVVFHQIYVPARYLQVLQEF